MLKIVYNSNHLTNSVGDFQFYIIKFSENVFRRCIDIVVNSSDSEDSFHSVSIEIKDADLDWSSDYYRMIPRFILNKMFIYLTNTRIDFGDNYDIPIHIVVNDGFIKSEWKRSDVLRSNILIKKSGVDMIIDCSGLHISFVGCGIGNGVRGFNKNDTNMSFRNCSIGVAGEDLCIPSSVKFIGRDNNILCRKLFVNDFSYYKNINARYCDDISKFNCREHIAIIEG